MGQPSNSDPDLDKRLPRPPAGGDGDAHSGQNPSRPSPQHPAQEDDRAAPENGPAPQRAPVPPGGR